MKKIIVSILFLFMACVGYTQSLDIVNNKLKYVGNLDSISYFVKTSPKSSFNGIILKDYYIGEYTYSVYFDKSGEIPEKLITYRNGDVVNTKYFQKELLTSKNN